MELSGGDLLLLGPKVIGRPRGKLSSLIARDLREAELGASREFRIKSEVRLGPLLFLPADPKLLPADPRLRPAMDPRLRPLRLPPPPMDSNGDDEFES